MNDDSSQALWSPESSCLYWSPVIISDLTGRANTQRVCSASGWLCNVLDHDPRSTFMCGSSSSRCAAKRSSFVFNLRMVCLGDDRTSTELPGRRALLKVSSKCGCCVRCLTVKTQVHSDSLKKKAKTARSRGICCICKGAQCEQGVPVQAVKSGPITLSKSWK